MNNQSVHVQKDLKCLAEITHAGEKMHFFTCDVVFVGLAQLCM